MKTITKFAGYAVIYAVIGAAGGVVGGFFSSLILFFDFGLLQIELLYFYLIASLPVGLIVGMPLGIIGGWVGGFLFRENLGALLVGGAFGGLPLLILKIFIPDIWSFLTG